MPLIAGTKIGPYEILSLLGTGGMGEVYRARDARLQRDVAVKILPASFAQDAERLRRFEQEARAVGALSHPNILAIHDVGAQDNMPYLVSELLEGESLRARLQSGPLPVRKAVDYGTQIARGLAAAHEKGIVHRDLKPDNIYILNDGRLKILDFGLAKFTQELAGADGETQDAPRESTSAGQVLGTVGYMSPEQVRGQAADHRADIFAFGAIFYEMLSGQRAFKRDSAIESMNAILKDEPPEVEELVPHLSPGLDRVVRHCLEKNPAQRFQSASDIAFDLETISGQSSSTSGPRATVKTRRPLWKPALGAVAVIAALAGTYFWGRGNAPASAPRFHQLTFQHGAIGRAKFTPDGGSILFSAEWNGAQKPQIYTTRTDALTSRPLDLRDYAVLGISSTGELAIKKSSTRGRVALGMLSTVPLTGGAPRELLDDVVDAAWGPDGRALAVIHFTAPEFRIEYPIGTTIVATRTGDFTDVAVSPDGKRIAYFDHPVLGDTRGFVAVTDLKGGTKRLTQEWSDLSGLAWSPGGGEIWFTGSDQGTNSPLYAVDMKGRLRDLLHVPGRLKLCDISKDGQVLLSNEATGVESYLHRSSQARDQDLSWFDWTIPKALSKDGQWAVLEEDAEGGGPQYTIFLRKTDGSPAIRLGNGMSSSISPDGKWVASTSVDQPAPTVLLPTGAGQPMTLADGKWTHAPATQFLPDGKGLIMLAAEPGKAMRTYILMLDGSAPRPIGPEDFTGFFLSPDGTRLLGARGKETWIVPMDCGPAQAVAGMNPGEGVVGWAADGHSIFVGDPSSLPISIYLMDLATGSRKLQAQLAPADPSGVNLVFVNGVAPDGTSILYGVSRTLSHLYTVDGLK